ncbi:MAG TPA: hypothetical protein VJB41_01860 [Patescibacteria group bacterium]|nr:hypothetical protein [Patescibacteria group bacterium]
MSKSKEEKNGRDQEQPKPEGERALTDRLVKVFFDLLDKRGVPPTPDEITTIIEKVLEQEREKKSS